MNEIAKFLQMGGYAGFVWPAFGIALAVMAGFVVTSLRRLRAREATLRALEAAAPNRPRRRRAAQPEAAAGERAEASR